MRAIQTSSRVIAEGYPVPGEVLLVLARAHGRITKVLHDDGFENYYRISQLTLVTGASPIRFIRPFAGKL